MDRPIAVRIADKLRQKRVRIWFDGWEMMPGELLRDRISSGIVAADVFVALLSPNALQSGWAKFELNAAMIREIEEQRVRVVPAITGDIDFSDLPLDMRAKMCLDFRTPFAFENSIIALTDFINPEGKLRRELVLRLQSPLSNDHATLAELREFALKHRDLVVQRAAVRGLEKLGGRAATLALLDRSLDPWGVVTIERALKALGRLAKDGGLLALTTGLVSDFRFYSTRLTEITRVAEANGDHRLAKVTRGLQQDRGPEWLLADRMRKHMSQLRRVENPDVRNGAMIATLVDSPGGWSHKVKVPKDDEITAATAYAESRLPGIINCLQRHRW